MKKTFLFLTIAVVSLLFAGCQADDKFYPQEDITVGDKGAFSFTAMMPGEEVDEGARTRVALTEEVFAIALTWQENDEIQLLFVQGDEKWKGSATIESGNISEDGKRASFQFDLPPGITSGTFDLYGLYGGGGLSDTNLGLAILPANTSDGNLSAVEAAEEVMLYFSAKDIPADNPDGINVSFKHLGAIFSVNLLNTSSSMLDLSGGVKLVANGSGSFYSSGYYNLLTETFSGGTASDHISFNAPVGLLAKDATITLYKWLPILPSGSINTNWPAINVEIDNKTSTNSKPGRTAEPGKNYLLYAQQEGSQISFTDPIPATYYYIPIISSYGNVDLLDRGDYYEIMNRNHNPYTGFSPIGSAIDNSYDVFLEFEYKSTVELSTGAFSNVFYRISGNGWNGSTAERQPGTPPPATDIWTKYSFKLPREKIPPGWGTNPNSEIRVDWVRFPNPGWTVVTFLQLRKNIRLRVAKDPDKFEKSTWEVASFKSQWNNVRTPDKLFDSDITSFWHSFVANSGEGTAGYTGEGGFPQWVIIDMKKTRPVIEGFKIWNRQNAPNTNGMPKNILFSVSDQNLAWDSPGWTDILEIQEMPPIKDELDYPTTNQGVTGRYLKVEIKSVYGTGSNTHLGEITPY